MKIGFDAKRAFNNVAGLGNFSRNTIRALARQYPNDRYFLFHPGDREGLFVSPDNSFEVKPSGFFWKKFKSAWRLYRVGGLAKDLKLDIYHGLSHELPAWIEKSDIRTIVTIHDLIYLRFPQYYQQIDRKIYDRKFRHACKVATKIHAISEQTRQDLMTWFFIPEEKIRVIYQSVNPVFFERFDEKQKQELRKKYQLPQKFILSVGTVEPRKNLMGLLEGMSLAKTYIPVVVVGKLTDFQDKIRKFIEADLNRLEVFFLAGIPDTELAMLYQLAEALVYPSFFEGFGLPVAEAQAAGCPVISSFSGSLPEVGADAALYVNPEKPEEIGQTLKNLLADRKLRNSMIEKGLANAQRFTPQNFARQMKQLYNSLTDD